MDYQKLRSARKAAKKSQEELAAHLGINRATVSKYETGIIEPSLTQLMKIASFLSIDPYMLMTGDIAEAHSIGYSEGLERARNEEDEIYRRQSSLRNAILESMGYSFSQTEMHLIRTLSQLTPEGQQKAVERIEELAEIPKYRKTPQE